MYKSAKFSTGLPISMPFNRMGLVALLLYYRIRMAKSGMYLPAYDQPAIKKVLLAYYGNLVVKKSLTANRLSLAVLASSYMKSGSLFILYPTPAGESMNSKLLMLVHPNQLKLRLSLSLYGCESLRQYGDIYCTNPIFDIQPGPPFIHSVTGMVLFTPPLPSIKIQCSFLRSDQVLRQPAYARLVNESSYPGSLAASAAGSACVVMSMSMSSSRATAWLWFVMV